jgi:hypothetical protein
MGGMEISLMVAIDFTGSNGDPRTPQSLHYIDYTGVRPNPYQIAIQAICSIVEPYDTDKRYPVYGFGAKVKDRNGQMTAVQHCFPVYGGGLEVHGVAGILQVGSRKSQFSGGFSFHPPSACQFMCDLSSLIYLVRRTKIVSRMLHCLVQHCSSH